MSSFPHTNAIPTRVTEGWLAAYSLHRPTFVFNSIAIAADVSCLFASAAWIAQRLLESDATGVNAQTDTPDGAGAANWLAGAMISLGWCGVVLGAVGGLGAHVLTFASDTGLTDNGLKVRTMSLPDMFQDQDDPMKQYDEAGLNAPQIVDTVLAALRHNSAGVEEARA